MNFIRKALMDKHGPKDSVISAMLKHLSREQPARSHKVIHASDLTKEWFCPREVALLDILKMERKPRALSAATAATFDVGNMTAELVREYWLGDHVVGHWRCVKCGWEKMFSPRPDAVTQDSLCEHNWRYNEVGFTSKTYGFTGSLDAILDLGAPLLRILEIKIMGAEQFAALNAPLAEHRIRTNLYMRLVEDSGSAMATQIHLGTAKILYVCRGHGKKHPQYSEVLPFKEFDIERNDADLKLALERAVDVKQWRMAKVMPPRCCAVSYQPEAKACPVGAQCFSAKYAQNSPLPNQAGTTTLPEE